MTLEDFFTSTEIKDGLTTPSRVHELVSVIQKERDCIVKNAGDATLQWTAVASTIAATEDRNCLDLFIQFNGLSFIDKWLKDVKMYGNDAADGFVEESVTALLRALEKLQIDKDRSVSSGIWITINNLLGHGSSRVQDRARALLFSWKQGMASDAARHDGVGTFHDATENSRREESADVEFSSYKKSENLENNVAESVRDENLQSGGSNCLQSVKVKEQLDANMEHLSSDPGDMPVLSNLIQDSPPLKEKVLTSAVEATTSTETRTFSISKGPSTESELDTLKKLNDSDMITSPCKVEAELSSFVANTTSAKQDTAEPAEQSYADAKESDFGSNNMFSDTGKSVSLSKSGIDDEEANKDCSPDTQPDSSLKKSEKPEDMETPFSHMLDIRADDGSDDEEHSSGLPEYLRDGCNFTKTADTRNNRRRSDVELDCGMVDAPEVARQVAQEVERAVVDYKQQSCSSSSEKTMASTDSPNSINTNRGVPDKDMPSEQNQAAEAFPVEDARLKSSNSMETEAENGIPDLESSQVTEVSPEQEIQTENGLSNFDLNREVCSDDMEHTMNPISTPVSVVSASRPAAASGSPSAPLQFEGILGWKGSAATSAFRPASPRKIFETTRSRNSSKHSKDILCFDLNVAEDGDEKTLDLMPGRPIPVSSGLQSGESSAEVGPRRSERPTLDLNMISNEGDVPQSTHSVEGQLFYPRDGHRSPSPASSSSSMQPSLKNFDLNDRPFFPNDQGLYSRNQNASPFGISKPADPVISLLGTRVEVGSRTEISRKEFLPQHLSVNGKPMDSVVNANVARMGGGVMGIPTVPYTHSPVFGYNGGPHMSIASIPYVMDARVTSMVPSVGPFSQPSFIMNMAGGPPSYNGAGPSRYHFDLNSGFANEGGNAGGLRQFLMPGQSRSMEDHLRANSSSGLGVKRREPDGGWESYSLPYKHIQPPWR